MPKRDNSPKRKATKRRLTANQEEWLHQLRNLKRRIKALEKYGLVVDYELPEMPKRVTKGEIEKLKGLRRPQLFDLPQKEIEFTTATPSPVNIADVELTNFINNIESYTPTRYVELRTYGKNMLLSMLHQRISEEGRLAVAEQLQRSAEAGLIVDSVLYASTQEQVETGLSKFARVVFNRALALDELQELEYSMEYNENYG